MRKAAAGLIFRNDLSAARALELHSEDPDHMIQELEANLPIAFKDEVLDAMLPSGRAAYDRELVKLGVANAAGLLCLMEISEVAAGSGRRESLPFLIKCFLVLVGAFLAAAWKAVATREGNRRRGVGSSGVAPDVATSVGGGLNASHSTPVIEEVPEENASPAQPRGSPVAVAALHVARGIWKEACDALFVEYESCNVTAPEFEDLDTATREILDERKALRLASSTLRLYRSSAPTSSSSSSSSMARGTTLTSSTTPTTTSTTPSTSTSTSSTTSGS